VIIDTFVTLVVIIIELYPLMHLMLRHGILYYIYHILYIHSTWGLRVLHMALTSIIV